MCNQFNKVIAMKCPIFTVTDSNSGYMHLYELVTTLCVLLSCKQLLQHVED